MTDQTSYESPAAEGLADDNFFSSAANLKATAVAPTDAGLARQGRRANVALKRATDLAVGLAIAAFFLPVMLVCAICLKLGGGSVLFSQPRVGKEGKSFKIYKFRTMVPNAAQVLQELLASDEAVRAEWQRDHKLKNDPRVTPIGRFLRRTSLDELPQLWNVLKGDMSLVGPRPVEAFEMLKYGVHARYYYAQKPGLTGLWQISGRSNVNYEQRVAMDTYYSRKQSLWLDLAIVLRTVRVVLFRSGAY
jgi:undecaprenyl-phosphate galactose phosphotransferase